MLHLRHCTVKSRPEGLIDIADGMVTVNGGECSIAEFNEATGRFDGVDNLTQTKYEEKGDTIVITGNSLAIHDFAADSGREVDGEARLSLVVTNRQGLQGLRVTFLILAVHSLVAWRITHFIILDTMFEGTRDRFVAWLTRPKVSSDGTYASAGPPLWRHKIWLLVTCPFCISVWAAAAVTWGHVWFVEELPFPVFWWLAVASGAMMVYAYVDSED